MNRKEDYQKIAYEVLMRRCDNMHVKTEGDIVADITSLKGIIGKYSLRVEQLSVNSVEELPKGKLQKAKANYIFFRWIKKRRPEIVSETADKIMTNLAQIIAMWEGTLLYEYIDGYLDFNIAGFRDYMLNPVHSRRIEKDFLYVIAEDYRNRRSMERKTEAALSECVIIFIDETTKINPLSRKEEFISNYSYIIAAGDLKKESQINSKNLIYEKVGQAQSTNHVEAITIEAMGNALFTLLYEYNYTNDVKILVDNVSAKNHWKKRKKTFAAYKCFRSVSVSHVSRKKNTKADALSRRNVALTMTRKDFDRLQQLKDVTVFETELKGQAERDICTRLPVLLQWPFKRLRAA